MQVGVVGRTGSGKCTYLLALYRVFDLEKGAIYVDGVNLAQLTLKRLRLGLSIIPQVRCVSSTQTLVCVNMSLIQKK